MPDKSIIQKLQIKVNRTVLFVNAPGDYDTKLGTLPEGVFVMKKAHGPIDLIQVFVNSRRELEEQLPRLKSLLTPGGVLWVTYHKGTSHAATGITRDSIAAYARSLGMQAVAQIAVDADWSALRLKII
jgi:hypothetical protein